MKAAWVLLVLAGLSSPIVTAEELSREQCIAEVVKALGLEELLVQSQEENKKATQKLLDQALAQIHDLMASWPAKQQEEFHAAIDRYTAAALPPLDIPDLVAAWGRFYSADMSDADLRDVVAFLRTPLGTKELKASTSATTQWANYV